MTEEQIANATREELIDYLTDWGYMCYEHESTDELREAAQLNRITEGE
jgi:hypothetical protein